MPTKRSSYYLVKYIVALNILYIVASYHVRCPVSSPGSDNLLFPHRIFHLRQERETGVDLNVCRVNGQLHQPLR